MGEASNPKRKRGTESRLGLPSEVYKLDAPASELAVWFFPSELHVSGGPSLTLRVSNKATASPERGGSAVDLRFGERLEVDRGLMNSE